MNRMTMGDMPRALDASYPATVYLNDEAILVCGECHAPLQVEIWLKASDGTIGRGQRVRCMCKCEAGANAMQVHAKQQQAFMERMNRLRAEFGVDQSSWDKTFEADDGTHGDVAKTCKVYVDAWQEMLRTNQGILLYGPPGTGKTYFAYSIANALAAQQVPAIIANLPYLIGKMQAYGDNGPLLDKIRRYPLLVIDDLGVERSTPVACEHVYSIINARCESRKPTIITTNLPLSQITSSTDDTHIRIYDRVMEMCSIRLPVTGKSRRNADAKRREGEAIKIMEGYE